MRWKHIVAIVLAAGTMFAASPAGLAALAAPSALGQFASWKAAQRAAGFKLLRPTKTFGHPRNGDIIVTRCEIKKKAAKRVVMASYGVTAFSTLGLVQNNSGAPCSSIGKVTALGKVKVDGTTAKLAGKCGFSGLRSCKSRKIFLFLTWTKRHVYYMAVSYGQPRKTLIGFAHGLRRVR
jgi:hypothetical protein